MLGSFNDFGFGFGVPKDPDKIDLGSGVPDQRVLGAEGVPAENVNEVVVVVQVLPELRLLHVPFRVVVPDHPLGPRIRLVHGFLDPLHLRRSRRCRRPVLQVGENLGRQGLENRGLGIL